MKKPNLSKLGVKTETLRVLASTELAQVDGGKGGDAPQPDKSDSRRVR